MDSIIAPCFIIHRETLYKNINELQQALSKNWGNAIIGYSFKTNSLPWVLKYVLDNNCFAEVVSTQEYKMALHIGYRKEKIIFNGPVKGKDEFTDSIVNNGIVNIDSKREIVWIKELSEKNDILIKIGVRVNLDLEEVCPSEVGYGETGARFGFSLNNGEFYKVVKELQGMENVQVTGLHLHTTSLTRSINIYKELAKKACEIKRKTKVDYSYIDIGGGFFGGMPDKPSFDEYIEVIAEELIKEYSPEITCLIVEPGSCIIGSPVSFVCDVIDVKDTSKSRIVTVNGSRINVDPLMIKNKHFYSTVCSSEVILERQVIGGFTCMEIDKLMVLHNEKELTINDRIIFKNVGAYTMSLSPLFIDYFPKVYVFDGDSYICVRDKWGVKEFVQNCYY